MIRLSQFSLCWIWHLTFSWEHFLSNKLEFFVSCNSIKVSRTSLLLLCVLILFYKKVFVLHHRDNNFLFWHLHQIHIFNNNLNDEEMIAAHLTCIITSLWQKCLTFMLQLLYDKNIMFLRERKQYQINLNKTCYMTTILQ